MLHLNLRSSDDIVNPVTNVLNLVLAVKVSLHSFISIDEIFELFLQAVILIIQIGHVLVKSVNLSLQIHLILQHLVAVLLQTVNLERDRLLVLLEFAQSNLKFLALHAAVLGVAVLELIGLEKLSLGGLMLLILTFEVTELTV